jgi:hypothetical protein
VLGLKATLQGAARLPPGQMSQGRAGADQDQEQEQGRVAAAWVARAA